MRGATEHACARVLGAVDAMAEAHQALAAIEEGLDVALGIALALDVVEHLQDARRGAAVERAGEGADRA